ncbi:Uncharacterised protein [Serratia rubidaea]|uniref:Uncharacterized protein n=1 Tax=Serratia rubidaea TaxID=61652 RepID=A0A4U9HBM7_SERRU|nr:Uncharacterised protein [Serratia rubidaea]
MALPIFLVIVGAPAASQPQRGDNGGQHQDGEQFIMNAVNHALQRLTAEIPQQHEDR